MQIRTRKNPFGNITEEKGKVIRKPEIARKILGVARDSGVDVRIIDIKPSKTDKYATCFVFRDDDNFQKIFESVLEENKKVREESETKGSELDELRKELAELKKAMEEKG